MGLPRRLRADARERLAEAIAALDAPGDLDTRVHAVRTALKKTRSLLWLADEDALIRRLARLGRRLAPARDARIIRDQVPWLEVTLDAAEVESILGKLHRPLEDARRRAKDVDATRREIEAAVVRGSRDVRRSATLAFGSGADADYHELRKAAKRHLHHMVWLEHPRAAELDHLSDVCGEDHDLVIVDAALRDAVARGRATPEKIAPLLQANGERRAALRAEIYLLVMRLFATVGLPGTGVKGGKLKDLGLIAGGTSVASRNGRAHSRRPPARRRPLHRLLPELPRRTHPGRGRFVRRDGGHPAQP